MSLYLISYPTPEMPLREQHRLLHSPGLVRQGHSLLTKQDGGTLALNRCLSTQSEPWRAESVACLGSPWCAFPRSLVHSYGHDVGTPQISR